MLILTYMSNPRYFPIDLLAFHRPLPQVKKYASQIPVLKEESRRCIRALASYTPRWNNVRYPQEKCAAVLVALFVGRKGDLYVLLSRCATRNTCINYFHPVTTVKTRIYLADLRW